MRDAAAPRSSAASTPISVYYDPMVSKLVTWGDDREQALARMRRALDEYRVSGIKTNLPFHRRLLAHPEFQAGRYDTGFIEREKATLLAPHVLDAEQVEVAIIAAALHQAASRPPVTDTPPPSGPSAWRTGLRR